MSAILPINLDDLLRCRGVESERVEFKASWDPHTTGVQVLRTVCAFANDYHNLNGGYVVIGVGERGGRAVLPPAGLTAEEVEAAQKWIRGNCNRVGAETVDAERRGGLLQGLIQQTARVPWDDRRATEARVEDLREANAQRRRQPASRRRLLTEARTLMERVIQLDASPTRHAWAWRELARTLNGLRAPFREVENAYRNAIEHLPAEARFARELAQVRASRRR